MHWSFTRSPLILSYPKIVKWMAIILCFDIPILPPKLWHALKWSFKIGNKDKKLDVEIFRLVRLYISLLLNFNSMNESSCRAVGTRGTRAPLRPFYLPCKIWGLNFCMAFHLGEILIMQAWYALLRAAKMHFMLLYP